MKFGRARGSAFRVASVVGVAIATLTPRPDQAELVARTPFWCIVCGGLGTVDVLLNVLLFAPFGAALGLAGVRRGRIAALSLVLSIAVELLQTLIPGRDPSVSDLLTNSLGGVLGGMAAAWAPHLVRPGAGLAGLLAGAWAGGWLIQTVFTAAVLQPALPRSWYWGQLAPDLEQFEQFTGKVAFASAGAYRIRIGRLATSSQIRSALLAGEPLVATSAPGDATPGIAPIVSIFDGEQREIVLLGRWADDLVYRLRTGAFDVRLRPPTIRLGGAFDRSDTLVRVVGRFDPSAGSFVVSLRSATDSLERTVPLDPQWGWSLLLPFPYAHGSESGWLTSLWVIAWMVPLGYWSAAYRRAAVAGAVIVLILGLGVTPMLWGLTAAAGTHWVAGGIGLGAGILLQRRSRRGQPWNGTDATAQPPRARSAASP